MRSVLFKSWAENDVEDAFRWYEERRNGLGLDFLLSVEESLNRFRRRPEMYPVVHGEIRRALIRRFPYAVFYIFTDDTVVVLAVLHARRDPDRIRNRT